MKAENQPPFDRALHQVPPLRGIGKTLRVGRRNTFIGLPYPVRTAMRLGVPRQAVYPYPNLVFVNQSDAT